MKRNIARKVMSENPSNCPIVGFWINGEIVCLQCLTEEEKKQNATLEDIIHRKEVEDPALDACDRCAQSLHRDFSGDCHG